MKKNIQTLLTHLAAMVVAGLFISAGMRLGEWVIPKPETRVVFCLAKGEDESTVCKTVDEWIRNNALKDAR